MNRNEILFVIALGIVLSSAYVVAENSAPRYVAPTSGGYFENTGYFAGRGCGGCRQWTTTQRDSVSSDRLEYAKKLATDYYTKTYGDTDFEVRVTDFGCHIQADIIKEGKVVKSLAVYGSEVYEF